MLFDVNYTQRMSPLLVPLTQNVSSASFFFSFFFFKAQAVTLLFASPPLSCKHIPLPWSPFLQTYLRLLFQSVLQFSHQHNLDTKLPPLSCGFLCLASLPNNASCSTPRLCSRRAGRLLASGFPPTSNARFRKSMCSSRISSIA